MTNLNELNTTPEDPLGLRRLPVLEPPADGWTEIAQSLSVRRRRRTAQRVAGLAVAASFLIIVVLVSQLSPPVQGPAGKPNNEAIATPAVASASEEREQTLNGLITMSQTLEQQLRGIRQGAGPMPASSAVYVAELEDLVAQVDNELSISPNSVNLWGQRVNLLLDLAQLYQQQWEREYGRMASL